MNRVEKQSFIAQLNEGLLGAELLVLTRVQGLTVGEVSDLRRQMRHEGVSFKVVKNTLARLALAGTQFASLVPEIKGPLAFAYSADPIAAAKVAIRYSKVNDTFAVIGGALGEKRLSIAEVKSLAELPSLDEMRAKVLGVVMAPAQQLAGILNATPSQLARVISLKK